MKKVREERVAPGGSPEALQPLRQEKSARRWEGAVTAGGRRARSGRCHRKQGGCTSQKKGGVLFLSAERIKKICSEKFMDTFF